jgi:ribosomal protein L29
MMKKARRDIARIKTVQRQREMTKAPPPAAAK